MYIKCHTASSCINLVVAADINSQNIVTLLPSIHIDCTGETWACDQSEFYLSSLANIKIKCYGAYSCTSSKILITSFDYNTVSMRTNLSVECFAYGACDNLLIDASNAAFVNITCSQRNLGYVSNWLNYDDTCYLLTVFAPNYYNGINKNIYLTCDWFEDFDQCQAVLVYAMYGMDQLQYHIEDTSDDYMAIIHGIHYNKRCLVKYGSGFTQYGFHQQIYENNVDFVTDITSNSPVLCNDSTINWNINTNNYNFESLLGNTFSTDIICQQNKNCSIFAVHKLNSTDITEGFISPTNITCSNALECNIWCIISNSCGTDSATTIISTNGAENTYIYLMDVSALAFATIYGNEVGGNIYIYAYDFQAFLYPTIYCNSCNQFYLSCPCQDCCNYGNLYLKHTQSITIECGMGANCYFIHLYITADINIKYDLNIIDNITVKHPKYLLSPIPYDRLKWICVNENSCHSSVEYNKIFFQYENQTEWEYYWSCNITYWNNSWYCNNYPLYVPNYPTMSPTINPTYPTIIPSFSPSSIPTANPTQIPSTIPTLIPTVMPSVIRTITPSSIPSKIPTLNPTKDTYSPTEKTAVSTSENTDSASGGVEDSISTTSIIGINDGIKTNAETVDIAIILIVIVIVLFCGIVAVIFCLFLRSKKHNNEQKNVETNMNVQLSSNDITDQNNVNINSITNRVGSVSNIDGNTNEGNNDGVITVGNILSIDQTDQMIYSDHNITIGSDEFIVNDDEETEIVETKR
eukprot:97909_1